ncbi:hypothetical protein N7491_011340 [Penicillium cf. griseofulvum]|uniref:Uncharacterized protein n=1 Tax=Penicillium cf. griseofulvum TaxID=2972120 RepID=A0A9W9JS10_9EURO|nr:hypothetical protein N7472_004659 [Penicillium cf. griseofulvum]KAJ5416438.1 hypothetical protein N7491_011340 [Penicillium cf. griseofulvum]KAJ5442225.1 hypothetical protein N7445_005232 [Penicillium cf. griseofulvum]
MASNNQDNHGQLPNTGKEHTVILPCAQKPNSSTDTTGSSGLSREGTSSEKSWKPSIDRQHSWSNEDRKHQLQERLYGSEKRKEMGFTEAHTHSGD